VGAILIPSAFWWLLPSQVWFLVLFGILAFLIIVLWLFPLRPRPTLPEDTAQKIEFGVRIFQITKTSSSSLECEDSARLSDDKRQVVIADGVSQSFESGLWARTLTKHLLRTEVQHVRESAIVNAAAEWTSVIESYLSSSTSWNVRKRVNEGAQATFASIVFEEKDSSIWWVAELIGDCLIAQIPMERESSSSLTFYPPDYADSLKKNPDTVSSRTPYVRGELRSFDGVISVGTRLLIMTDALGVYLTKKSIDGVLISSIFPFLDKTCINPEENFKTWANLLRPSEIADDDLTLVEITYE